MMIALMVIVSLAGIGIGFAAGVAYSNGNAKRKAALAIEIERAELKGKIAYLEQKNRKPGIEPPSDIYKGGNL